MNIEATDIALAESVTPRGVHAYLAANGWMKQGSYHGNTGDVYCLREDEREAVLVPASAKFADYVTRLMQLVETLGRVENRRQSTVLTDLSLAEVDLIRVRLHRTFDDSSIPLSAGVSLLDDSRKLLLAAACSASRPQRLFRAGRNQKAAAYVEHVRLGQTEPGSFVGQHAGPRHAIADKAGIGTTAFVGAFRAAGRPDARLRVARFSRSNGACQSRGRHSCIRGTGRERCKREPVPGERQSDQHRQWIGRLRKLGAHKTAARRSDG